MLINGSNVLHPLALDASVTINLNATGMFEEVVASVPYSLHVTEEIIYEIKSFDLFSFVNSNIIKLDVIDPAVEAATFIYLAHLSRGDGESACGTLAIHRGYAVAIDDNRAKSVLKSLKPDIIFVTTPDIIYHWLLTNQIVHSRLRQVLQDVKRLGHYTPPDNHPLHDWWQQNCI